MIILTCPPSNTGLKIETEWYNVQTVEASKLDCTLIDALKVVTKMQELAATFLELKLNTATFLTLL